MGGNDHCSCLVDLATWLTLVTVATQSMTGQQAKTEFCIAADIQHITEYFCHWRLKPDNTRLCLLQYSLLTTLSELENAPTYSLT